MTTCQDLSTDLQLHHDGELDAPGAERVERHLASCQICRARFDSLAFVRAQLRAADSAEPTPDLWASIAARLPELDAASRSDAVWWRRLSALGELLRPGLLRPMGAALAFATIGAVLVLVRTPTPIDVVRSIDAKGRPVMVLPSADGATIIWLMDDGDGAPGSGDATTGL